MTIRTKLTRHPKLQASKELLAITLTLCKTEKECFIEALDNWSKKWEDFLTERAKGKDGKTHYVYKNTRSAYFSLRRNMKWLWTWYDYPEIGIPNTNNELEALNDNLKAKLALHKGISLERRKILIQNLLKTFSS